MSTSTIRLIKSEIKNNLSLSLPITGAQLIYACSGFVGTALVARLGEDALAASVLVSTIWMAFSVLFFGILNAAGVLVAHQYGANNKPAISKIMGQAFLLGLVVSIIMISFLLCLPKLLILSTQQPLTVLKLANDYIHSLIWTVPSLILIIICEQFLAGANRPKIILRMSVLIVPIEITLIYLFIFGLLGLPKLGIAGVGYGFAVTYTATAIFLIYYLSHAKPFREYQLFANITKLHLPTLNELIRVGLPIGLMHIIEVSTFALATIWISHFGVTILAAHQIALQYLGFVITIVFAMSQAVTIRVGHAVGSADLKSVNYAAYVGIGLNSLLMFVIALSFFFIPEFFLSIDINVHDIHNQALIQETSALFKICALLILCDNFRIILFGALRGLKETKFPMIAAFISCWGIGLSSAYLFGFTLHLDGIGIWLGLTFGIFCGAIILWVRLRQLLSKLQLPKAHVSA